MAMSGVRGKFRQALFSCARNYFDIHKLADITIKYYKYMTFLTVLSVSKGY